MANKHFTTASAVVERRDAEATERTRLLIERRQAQQERENFKRNLQSLVGNFQGIGATR